MRIQVWSKSLIVLAIGISWACTVSAQGASQTTPPQSDRGGWGCGGGPGMIGGAGPGGGMMGYGMGPGMMRGFGMGSGMGFNAWTGTLDLTDAQRVKINQIQDDTRKTHWTLMGNMLDQQARLRDLYEAPKRDSAEITKTYKAIDAIRQKMFDSSIDARKRIEALLTAQQQEKLRSYRSQQQELQW
ncbi:hypothetical protein PPGU19_092270 (plasmid) [Paraburkholderia sp. PGU19]|uniref:Spy/CpxP family protein refolding chaperone n=1 Tax=Paraburkholderia sp. PGU19 TaxID=2735434 RepID=UPI0015DBBDEF|nr:Spy/CpxP family protein refolding chaperone [Paraburkholderia sp. PGU19]BCG04659.1 hypothetical protein PPGU19_092270 [Paraburkholderia sp. PGU19]